VCDAPAVNFKQLRYFVAAVDLNNITRAAQKMHVAQPALGAQLRELEEEMGVPLLSRHSRGVEPTPAGQVLYQQARRILDQVDQVKAEVVRAHLAARRPVSFGLPTSLTLLIGMDLQVAAAERTQGVALSIVEGPSFFLADAIERQELDLAFIYDVEPRPGLALRVILDEELLFVSAAAAPAAESVTLAQVLESRLALGGRRDVGRRALARAAGVLPEAVAVAYETQSIAAILDLIERGQACSVMPYGSVAREVRAGRLRVQRIAGRPLRTTMYLARRAHLDAADADALLSDAQVLVDHGVDMIVERAAPYVERH
jgi:LysR family nitrogen assimilation transcriptional regulator